MATPDSPTERLLERTIFASRWLQAPLYVGLILAQAVTSTSSSSNSGT
jgi:uncharacterized membrane protein YqhA